MFTNGSAALYYLVTDEELGGGSRVVVRGSVREPQRCGRRSPVRRPGRGPGNREVRQRVVRERGSGERFRREIWERGSGERFGWGWYVTQVVDWGAGKSGSGSGSRKVR